jgi:hypothetical protein
MILEIAKERYKNQTGAEFKRFHWWKADRHQPKWRARLDAPSSEAVTEEEVTHPIGRHRAKAASRKGKGKKGSSSQSRSSSSKEVRHLVY